ncbi:MAG: preprotein translocase subunit SecE [Actinobacteria bacterium]|nr:preprotein translocase subunit SecE [Actinomycetota bacterium]
MSTDLNREQKRALKRMGALDDKGNPVRTQPQSRERGGSERVGPGQYMREVGDEMKKVAWPKWPEVRRYSIIVLATVLVFTAYIGALDAVFGFFSGWLYKE